MKLPETGLTISFDLDDTLICHHPTTPRENRSNWFLGWLSSKEPIRLGTCELIHELRNVIKAEQTTLHRVIKQRELGTARFAQKRLIANRKVPDPVLM